MVGSTVTLSTYDSNKFIAEVYLDNWSVSDSEFSQFSLTGINAGKYLVKIARPGYLSRYLKINLNDNVIDLGNKVLLAGDVNGDDKIDQSDSALLKSLYGKQYGTAGYLISADLNGDKTIDIADLALLTPNLDINPNIYNENVNVINVKAVASNTVMTISGTAKANSVLRCVVTFNDIVMYEEVLTCDSFGSFQGLCNLSQRGDYYKIIVTSDDRAIDAETELYYY